MDEQLAGGKLLLDSPAEAVVRLRISNPERRNALDHEILDALAETLPRLDQRHRDPLRPDHRRAAGLLRRLRHRLDPRPRPSSATPRRSSPTPSTRRWRRSPTTPGRPSRRSTATASAAGWSWRSPATCGSAPRARSSACRRPSSASSTATPACASSSTRSAWRGPRSCSSPAATSSAERAERDRPRQRSRRRRAARRRGGRAGRRDRRQRAALDARQQAARSTCSTPAPILSEQQEAGLIALRESCFASEDLREGIRAFAEKRKPEWKGTMSAKARKALAAADPTMAALIERVGEIDLATRLRRRSEERPADAYGALLRAIVGQQLSTKAARTIYRRVLDLFDGTHPAPEQLLEAERGGPARRRALRPQGRVHPRPRLPRDQRRAGARPPRPSSPTRR